MTIDWTVMEQLSWCAQIISALFGIACVVFAAITLKTASTKILSQISRGIRHITRNIMITVNSNVNYEISTNLIQIIAMQSLLKDNRSDEELVKEDFYKALSESDTVMYKYLMKFKKDTYAKWQELHIKLSTATIEDIKNMDVRAMLYDILSSVNTDIFDLQNGD